MPTNIELQIEIDQLKQELETLKSLFYKDNYTDLQVFRKKVQFKSNLTFTGKFGAFGKTPTTQQGAVTVPTGGVTQDAESRTAIGQIKTALQNLGLTL